MSEDCKKCKSKICRGDKAVMCCLCSCWQHATCSKISDSNYKSITELGSLVMWFCDADRRKLKSLLVAESNDREDVLLKEIEKVSSKLDEVKQSLDNNPRTMSYAEIVSGATRSTTKTVGMIIKPKENNINSVDTEKTIRTSINLLKINTGVTKIKHVQNGGVFVGARNSSDLLKLRQETEKVMGNGYDVYIPKFRRPKVVIRGVQKEYNYDDFRNELIGTNPGFDDDDALKVVHHKQIKLNNVTKWMYFIEVSGRTFDKIVDRYLNLDFNSYLVREYVDVLRCYKCQKYGHKSALCKSQQSCGKCGGLHDFKNCQADFVECVNCKEHNERNSIKVAVSHVCGSSECHIQIAAMKKQKERIDYNSQADNDQN